MSQAEGKHWAAQKERGSFLLMRFILWLTQVLGRKPVAPLLYLIVLYFFITSRAARNNIRTYYTNLARWSGRDEFKASGAKVFRQFMSFTENILDKFDVWHGRLGLQHLDVEDPHGVRPQAHSKQGRGQILVGAHLGNLEVCRALAEISQNITLNVLVHTVHAQQINRLLTQSGASQLRLIQVSDLDAATMMLLSQRIDDGEWLAIAGDRVPLHEKRRSLVQFLGQPAYLPQGPWLLAGLLQCPVNLFFCLKINGRYRICVESFSQRIEWQRNNRQQVLDTNAQQFADRLALRCLEAPDQWFNFYPFWNTDEQKIP